MADFDFKTATPVTTGVTSAYFLFGAASQVAATPEVYTVGAAVGSSTATFTNKTFDTAGTGNSFSINGLAATANTGTGAVARAVSPAFTTPNVGAATATSVNGLTITSSTGTLTIAASKTLTSSVSMTLQGGDASVLSLAAAKTLTASVTMTLQGGDASVLSIAAAKTLTCSNTLTFTGTDASSVAFGTGGTVLYTASTIPLTVGTTTIASGTNTRILYNNSGVLGEYTLTGTGTVVAMQTSPSFTTPSLNVATATSINGLTITSSTGTLTIANSKTLTSSVTMTLQGGDASVLSIAASKTATFSNSITFAGTDSTTMTFPSTSQSIPGLALNNTWSRGQTITQATANEAILTSTGLSLTGSNAQSFIDLAGTWNTSGTPAALKINITNTASNAASVFADFQVGGTRRVAVTLDGTMAYPSGDVTYISQNGSTVVRSGSSGSEFVIAPKLVVTNAIESQLGDADGTSADRYFKAASSNNSYTYFSLWGDAAADTLALRNGTSANTLRVYRTKTDASNYERQALQSGAGYFEWAAETAGTGTDNINLRLTPVGTGEVLINGPFSRGSPVTKTADFTLASTENWIINDRGATNTVTMPAASAYPGREVMMSTIQAQAVVSASSNIVPRAGGAAGTAILAATDGAWATLVSDGTNWIIMQGTP